MVELADILPSSDGISSLLKTGLWTLLIVTVMIVVMIMIRQKVIYRYSAEIHLRRQDDDATGLPTSQILSGRAGYIGKKGMERFRIKYGFMPWQVIDVLELPNTNYMIGNKAYFLQYQKGQLVQAKKTINWKFGEIELEPVSNINTEAIRNEIATWDHVLAHNKLTPQLVLIAGMTILLVAGIIVFYFLSKA